MKIKRRENNEKGREHGEDKEGERIIKTSKEDEKKRERERKRTRKGREKEIKKKEGNKKG